MKIARSFTFMMLAIFSSLVLSGCPTREPECSNDNDCCSKPNPTYSCYDGDCIFNEYFAYDPRIYNARVQQCQNSQLGQGGNNGYAGSNGGNCADLAPDPNGVALPVPEMPQYCNEWCWAAAIAMVAQYYGKPVSECALAGVKTGYYQACCDYYMACANPCNQTAQPSEITTILSKGLGLYGYFSQTISEKQLKTELTNGRPVYIMFSNSFVGHAAVISGYVVNGTVAYYHIIDPWSGPFDITYASLLNGPNGLHWTYTISRISTNSQGCNPAYNPDCQACP